MPERDYKLDSLQVSDKEKDFVAVITRLSPEDHIKEKVRTVYNLWANMRVDFAYVDEEIGKKLTASFNDQHPNMQHVGFTLKSEMWWLSG